MLVDSDIHTVMILVVFFFSEAITDGIKIPAGGEATKPTNLVSSNYGLIIIV